MCDGSERIADEELIYRRIPVSLNLYNPDLNPSPDPRSFRPIKLDTNGLSLVRAKYSTPQQVAVTDHGRKYWIAVLKAGDIRACSIGALDVVPAPLPNNPGHAEIPSLTYQNRRDTDVLQLWLADNCVEILGPFPVDDSAEL